MAQRAVGLDVGTSAVRAVELVLGREQVTLTRFGQVGLPAGAVQAGEVLDAPAVASAIRRLWREAGFRSRTVVVGVGNQRVVVRQADLPEMRGADLRSALQFPGKDLKRRANPASPDDLESRTAQIVAARSTLLIEEIRGSLDYYQAQPEASPIGRIILTGGGSRTIGLGEALEQTLGIPVEEGHPLSGVQLARTGIPEERLLENEALLSVPIGLALAARAPESGLRRLSVLPVEVAAVRTQRRQMVLVSAGVAGLAVVLLLLWVARQSKVHDEEQKADQAQRENTQLQPQVAGLQSVTALDTQLAQRRQLVTAAWA